MTVPAEWQLSRSEETGIYAFGPNPSGYLQGGIVKNPFKSAEGWIQYYLDFVKQTSHEHFEIEQKSNQMEPTGEQAGYLSFRMRTNQDPCLIEERNYLVVTRSKSYLLRTSICAEAQHEFEHVAKRFFGSFTILQ